MLFDRKAYKEVYVCREHRHNKNKEGTQGPAQMILEIVSDTENPPLKGVIEINAVHNHSTQKTAFLTRLHPSQATKRKFDELFEDGHGPTSARVAYIDMLKVTSEKPAASIIRGDLVPTMSSVAHSYRRFRTEDIENQSQLRCVFVSNNLMYEASISNQLITEVFFWWQWLQGRIPGGKE